jgi:phosphate transport system permease protein
MSENMENVSTMKDINQIKKEVRDKVEKKSTKKFIDNFAKDFFTGSGIFIVVILLSIFVMLIVTALPAFEDIKITNFLFSANWNPSDMEGEAGSYGILAQVASTFLVTVGAMILCVPLGIGLSIYLSEIAPMAVREIFKPVIEILAGVPSVVIGFIGVTFLSGMIGRLTGESNGINSLNASICLAIMALPTIVSMSEDAIKNVPLSFREASYALGCTKWETIRRVVVPAAKSGVFAAIMLGMGRAIGETMTVLMVAGNSPAMPHTFLSPSKPMTSTIALEMGDIVVGSTHYHALFAIALVLFIITFSINVIADINIHKKPKGVK